MLRLVPAYTLEMLDNCDIDRMLNYYFWDYRKAMFEKSKSEEESKGDQDSDIVYRDGKPYRKVKPQNSSGMKSL